MKALFGAAVVGLSMFAMSSSALAVDKGTKEEAVAMVKKPWP
jgi:hypothetical protein